MKLKALSNYDGDRNTRFGDCMLLSNGESLVVYDCGHTRHAERTKRFLESNPSISQVHIVVSHNDGDHTGGVLDLLWHLNGTRYVVMVYTSLYLYLESAREILEHLDDGRRTLTATEERILQTFDNIKEVVEKAEEYGFETKNAAVGTAVASCNIVGPREDEFVAVVAQAIQDADAQIAGETVMNAASVQLKCKLDNAQTILLCGDGSPEYLHRLDSYDVIQLPHHGKLDSAKAIFEKLDDSYSKMYFISDNTGTGATSGGSNETVKYMQEECYDVALNTQDGIIDIPQAGFTGTSTNKPQGVKLGEMDCWC